MTVVAQEALCVLVRVFEVWEVSLSFSKLFDFSSFSCFDIFEICYFSISVKKNVVFEFFKFFEFFSSFLKFFEFCGFFLFFLSVF